MSTDKKYTSFYDIKDFSLNELGPKYFPEDVVEGYNVGLLGLVLDITTDTTEDVFNTVPVVINEMYPNLAQMPSSIYNYAALFRESHLMAKPAVMDVVLLLAIDSLLEHSEVKDGQRNFILDERTMVKVVDHEFLLDYDIQINIKPYRDDFIFTAKYKTDYNNSLRSLNSPYIKLQKFNYKGTKYVALLTPMRRVTKVSTTHRVLDNDKINSTTISIPYSDQLANFEVYYRESVDDKYIQLQKKIINSRAIKNPFCYFRLKDNQVLEISFTNRENYFKPKFNSEIIVDIWETDGTKGNFERYLGNDVEVYRNSDKYENNSKVPVIAIPQTASVGGKDRIDLMDLRDKVADSFATVDSYTTEADLQRHFNSFDINDGTRVTFIKKRDDIFDRLYTSFSLCKDTEGSYYKTNTLQLRIYKDQFDHQFEQSKRLVLKPMHTFVYDGDNRKCARLDDGEDIIFNNKFLYNNPFLMTLSDNGVVGYYTSNINETKTLDFSHVNDSSLVQFIGNKISVRRSVMANDDEYELTVNITATDNDLRSPIVDDNGDDTNRVKCIMSFADKSDNEVAYIECEKVDFDSDSLRYTFKGKIRSDDYIANNETVRIYDLLNIKDGSKMVRMLKMIGLKVRLHIFFKYDTGNTKHQYNHLPGFEDITLTNTYETDEDRVSLVKPLNMLRSHMSWKKDDNGRDFILIRDVPFIKHVDFVDERQVSRFDHFIGVLNSQHDYMKEIIGQKTNNYSVDMKFYNTYGYSNNFVINDSEETLNWVNSTIHLQVYPHIRSEGSMLARDMKLFIKDYFESVNKDNNEGIFISNLIQQLENTFPQIRYIKFVSINGYDPLTQTINNKHMDLNELDKMDRIEFVPEYINIEIDDINIELLV